MVVVIIKSLIMKSHSIIMLNYHTDLGEIRQENTEWKEMCFMLSSKTDKVIGDMLKSELNMEFIITMIMVISTLWKCQEELGTILLEMKDSKET